MNLWERIGRCGIIAVLVIDDADHAVPAARALLEGGVTAMELTLRTPAAIESLRRIRSEVPEMLAGIGTVLSPEQIDEVYESGAEFAVSPGLNARVVEAANKRGLPFAPGICTPSELELAIELGCTCIKYFPAEAQGGLNFLHSMMAPYQHLGIRVIPLGGISLNNLTAYISDPLILAVGGSWLAKREIIQSGDFTEIRNRSREASDILKRCAE